MGWCRKQTQKFRTIQRAYRYFPPTIIAWFVKTSKYYVLCIITPEDQAGIGEGASERSTTLIPGRVHVIDSVEHLSPQDASLSTRLTSKLSSTTIRKPIQHAISKFRTPFPVNFGCWRGRGSIVLEVPRCEHLGELESWSWT